MAKINHGLFTSKTSEWETPAELFEQLDAEFHFDLDPAATDENAKCRRYFTLADDGLSQPWAPARVFLNPPYGFQISVIIYLTPLCYNERAMKLTTQVQVGGDIQALIPIINQANAACNHVSKIAFSERIFSRIPLVYRCYHEVRQTFGLPSALTLAIIRKVAAAYTNKERRTQLAVFNSRSLPLYKHRYRRGSTHFYGLRFPVTARLGVDLPTKPCDAVLVLRDGKAFIHQPIDVDCAPTVKPNSFLGIDLGIVNIAVDSDGVVYSGAHLNALRHRHARLRGKLQAKGTKSARRLLRKRRMKESRFARWVNHNISKALVNTAQRHSLGLALEDLKGIRERVTVRHDQRRAAHAWAFQQLRAFLEYKATLAGIALVAVDPRNTSRTCPQCGFVAKANRRSQSQFLCGQCGFAGLADHIAAMNIRGRAVGDRPYAGVLRDSCESASSRQSPYYT